METHLKLYLRVFLLFFLLFLPLILSANQQEMPITEVSENSAFDSIKAGVYQFVKPVPSEAYWYFQTSVYTQHFHPKPEHNNQQLLLGIERNRDDSYLWGGATFLNSFEQRSVYAYAGKRFDFGQSPFYSKLTVGLIHGYKG